MQGRCEGNRAHVPIFSAFIIQEYLLCVYAKCMEDVTDPSIPTELVRKPISKRYIYDAFLHNRSIFERARAYEKQNHPSFLDKIDKTRTNLFYFARPPI